MIALIILQFIIISLMCYTLYRVEQSKKELEIRIVYLEKWLFESLYTINTRVLKPEEVVDIKEVSSPAKVYNPQKDPMSEFNGKRIDFNA